MKKNKSKATIIARCPCCDEEFVIEISPRNMDFLIKEDQKQVKVALEKNGIELASMKGGE